MIAVSYPTAERRPSGPVSSQTARAIGANRLSRLVAAGDVALPGEEVLVELPSYRSGDIHFGGGVHFGPDGKLYLAVGDHGGKVVAQSLTRGTADDPEDGPLGPERFTWQVNFHHDMHWHPFVPATSGVTSGSFTIPTQGRNRSRRVVPDRRCRTTITNPGLQATN